MIATIQSRNSQQFQFRAMISGLHLDEVAPGVFDVTYRRPEQVLGVIKEAGGRILAVTPKQPLSKSERFTGK